MVCFEAELKNNDNETSPEFSVTTTEKCFPEFYSVWDDNYISLSLAGAGDGEI
jgi:hypothetical protein